MGKTVAFRSDKIRRIKEISTLQFAPPQAACGKTGTLREIQTAAAAARNHPADGEVRD
jgi:hypothetical protein